MHNQSFISLSQGFMLLVIVTEAHKIDLDGLQVPRETYSNQKSFNTPTSVNYRF